MGAFLDKPKTEKHIASGEGNGGIRYGISAMQGWRMEMEDAHTNKEVELGGTKCSFFGVFDGHAGPKVAQHCSSKLLDCIKEQYEKSDDNIAKAMYEGFLQIDKSMQKQDMWRDGQDRSGTTAVVTMITPDKIILGNCGDSRGILYSGGDGVPRFSTIDHKPYNEVERNRIERAGGTVMMQRVNGSLAVSRALGDFDYKRNTDIPAISQLVSPEPEMTTLDRDPENDQFLLLACDGIFDVMSNEEIVKYVLHQLELTSDLTEICSSLIDTCLNKNSRDNMSVILVTFPAAPIVSKEAIQKEKELQSKVMEKVESIIKDLVTAANDPIDVEENHVLDQLNKTLEFDFDVYTLREEVSMLLSKERKIKFGNDDEMSGNSDPSDAPLELLSGGMLQESSPFSGFSDESPTEMASPQPTSEDASAPVSHPVSDTATGDTEPKTIM